MHSFNPQINSLHAGFCAGNSFMRGLTFEAERMWQEAIKVACEAFPDAPLTEQDVVWVIMERKRKNNQGGSWGTNMRQLVGTPENLDNFLDEVAACRAKNRKAQFSAGKIAVLKDTHRPTEPEQQPARSFKEVIHGLKEAIK